MSLYDGFFDFCEKTGCKYLTGVELKDYTSFKIGGRADAAAFPDSLARLSQIVSFVHKLDIPVLVMGKGSNLLVSDDGFRGVVINTSGLDEIKLIDETTVYCECGASLLKLCRFALENSLTGLEFAYGIPGSAGGAAYMNAGAYGGEMKDVLIRCEHTLPDGSSASFAGAELELDYRRSAYSDSNLIVNSLTLELGKGDKAEIKAKMDGLMNERKAKQPLEYPSAGSVFKRPAGFFVGELIERLGLKGLQIGGARVSDKHAGFIINAGSATSADVEAVIARCRAEVFRETGVLLEPEIKIVK